MGFWLRAGAALLAVLALNVYAEGNGMKAGASARPFAAGAEKGRSDVAFSCAIPMRRAVMHICPRA